MISFLENICKEELWLTLYEEVLLKKKDVFEKLFYPSTSLNPM